MFEQFYHNMHMLYVFQLCINCAFHLLCCVVAFYLNCFLHNKFFSYMLPIVHGITSRNLEHICVFFFLFEECEFGKHFCVAEF
jgi:hypothetical protein